MVFPLPQSPLHWCQRHLHRVVYRSHLQVVYPNLQHGIQMNNSTYKEKQTYILNLFTQQGSLQETLQTLATLSNTGGLSQPPAW